MVFSPKELESLIEEIEEHYDGLLDEHALEDREGAMTHGEFMKVLEQNS